MHPKPKDDKQRGLWENKRSQFVSSPENVSYSHFDIITREGPNPLNGLNLFAVSNLLRVVRDSHSSTLPSPISERNPFADGLLS